MPKKNVATKVAKPVEVAKPRAKKEEPNVKFKSFSVGATIPVMSYGNIEPRIEVEAESYAEAKAFVMPLISELFAEFAEAKPTFLGKITEEVKVVAPTPAPAPKEEVQKEESSSSAPAQEDAPASTTSSLPSGEKPTSVVKAENAIAAASAPEAALKVQQQIEDSVKIPQEWKPYLITLVLKRRTEVK